jgi:hypothetical protein
MLASRLVIRQHSAVQLCDAAAPSCDTGAFRVTCGLVHACRVARVWDEDDQPDPISINTANQFIQAS